ncbi:hypothetical protein ES703_56654 [subsurface metagenome]
MLLSYTKPHYNIEEENPNTVLTTSASKTATRNSKDPMREILIKNMDI